MNKTCKICVIPVKKPNNTYCSRKCATKDIKPCPPHYKGINHPNWKGGHILRDGYIYVLNHEHPFSSKQGYIAEHRLILEKSIGRFIKLKEVIHHINGNRMDNRLENLQLFDSPGQHTAQAHPEVAKKTSKCNKGKHYSPETEFKQGLIPWNKGRKK